MDVDRNLVFSCEQIKDNLIKDIVEIKRDRKILEMDPFPSPHVLAQLARAVYFDGNKSEEMLPRGWKSVTTAFNKSKENGYFGAVYCDPSRQQVVIAHRGTEITNLGDLLTNINGVIKTEYTSQMNSAVTFSDRIMTELREVNREKRVGLRLSLTGHSLGAWLAQITAFTLKYVRKDGNEFKKIHDRLHDSHVHTVTFDSPGCGDMLSRIIDDGYYRYGKAVSPNDLDITNYLGPPNRINTTGTHVGTIRVVSIDLSRFSAMNKHTPLYNLAIHKIDNFVEAFASGRGSCQVLDWPVSRGMEGGKEYLEFHAKATYKTKYIPPSEPEAGYIPKIELRYNTENIENSCDARNFSEKELDLLDFWSSMKANETTVNNVIEFFLSNYDLGTADNLLVRFKKDNHTITCNSKTDLETVIRHTKQLMRWFHGELTEAVHQRSAQEPKIVVLMYQTMNRYYSDSLPRCRLDFRDTLGLEVFLDSGEARILHVQAQDGEFEVARLSNLLSRMRDTSRLEHLDKYLRRDRHAFVNWSRVMDLENTVDIDSFCKTAVLHENLLVVEHGAPGRRSPGFGRGEIFNRFIMTNDSKKIIFVTPPLSDDGNSLISLNVPVTRAPQKPMRLGDLTQNAQRTLFARKLLIVSGKEHSLADYVEAQNLSDFLSHIDTFIDAQMFKRIVTDPTYTIEMKNPFTTQNNLLVHSSVNTEVDATRVVRVLREHSRRAALVVSGVSPEELGPDGRWKELKDIGSEVVIAAGADEGESRFKEMCRNKPDTTVYRFAVSAGILYFKQMYSKSFYMERRFHNRTLFDINKFLQKNKGDDLFIFQNVTDKRSLVPGSLQLSESEMNLFLQNENIKTTASPDEIESILTNSNKPAHVLKVEEDGHCLWQSSRGPLDGLRLFVSTDTTTSRDEREMCESERKLVIIADEPGMGKSTSLTSLSRMLRSALVIRVNLKDFQSSIHNLPSELSLDSVIEFLLRKKSTKNRLLCGILQYCLRRRTGQSKHVYLLFDGFDEIKERASPTNQSAKSHVLRLFKYLNTETAATMWITTRLHRREVLENELSTFAMKFEKISESQQRKYLAVFWRSHSSLEVNTEESKLEMCAELLYRKAAEVLGDDIESFMGIPLQMRMLAEVFLQPVKDYVAAEADIENSFQVGSAFSLYQQFIRHKYEIYFDAKTDLNAGTSGVVKEAIGEKITDLHRTLGVRTLFSNFAKEHFADIGSGWRTELSRVGLVQSGGDESENIEFVHRTLAEYYCADLAADWLNKKGWYRGNAPVVEFLLSQVLLRDSSRVIRIFLNNFLLLSPLSDDAQEHSASKICKLWNKNQHSLFEDQKTALHVAVAERNDGIVNFLTGGLKSKPARRALIAFVAAHNRKGHTALGQAAQRAENDEASDKIMKSIVLSVEVCPYKIKLELLLSTYIRSPPAKWLRRYLEGEAVCSETKTAFRRVQSIIMEEISPFLDAVKESRKGDIHRLYHKMENTTERRYLLMARDGEGNTALHLAARNKGDEEQNKTQRQIIQILFDKNISRIERLYNELGETPLHCAAASGCSDTVRYFISRGVRADVPSLRGDTALSHAAMRGHLSVVELLAKKGADVNSADKYGCTALKLAIKFKQLPVAMFLVDKGANIDTADMDGRTALGLAVVLNNFQNVEFLIQKGADMNVADKEGRTALSLAAEEGLLEMVKLLAERGADIDSTDKKGQTALSRAAEMGHLRVAEFLINKGANVHSKDKEGETALSQAAEKGLLPMVTFLVEKGADINSTDKEDQSALSQAAEMGHLPVVEFLVKKGADLCSMDKEGKTALSQAAAMGHLLSATFLVENGANINSADKEGKTALYLAAEKGLLPMVSFLVEKGADMYSEDKEGQTALSRAAEMGHLPVVELLMGKEVDVNPTDWKEGAVLLRKIKLKDRQVATFIKAMRAHFNSTDEEVWTPLNLAAYNGYFPVVEYLVENGTDIDSSNKKGRTALHQAACNKNVPMVKFLIQKGANIESKDTDGQVTLFRAVNSGHLPTVELLVDEGADIDSTDNKGWTPLNEAVCWNDLEMVKFLIEKGAATTSTDIDGRTVLSWAASSGFAPTVDLLVEKGVNVNSKDRDGRTALSRAAGDGYLSVVKLLVEKGAHVNSRDEDGRTALFWANSGGHQTVVEFLVNRGADRHE